MKQITVDYINMGGVNIMSRIKVVAVAGERSIAKEILEAVISILGQDIDGKCLSAKEFTGDSGDVDLVVCLSSRVNDLSGKVPADKIVGIELVPDNRFYIEMIKIPKGESVYFLANTKRSAEMIWKYCQQAGIDHLYFEPLPWDELDESEIGKHLLPAKNIMTADSIIDVVNRKFRQYISTDANMVIMKRVANLKTICNLMQWATLFAHRKILIKVTNNTDVLAQKLQSITAIAQQISSNIKKESGGFDKLKQKMEQSMSQLEQVKQKSQMLYDTTKNIGEVTNTISYISGQTNLLALNATIEAARVGDAGRGFMVVAKEVGKLANESQESTTSIRKSINEIKSCVDQVVPDLQGLNDEMNKNQTFLEEMVQASIDSSQSILTVFTSLEEIRNLSEELTNEMMLLADTSNTCL